MLLIVNKCVGLLRAILPIIIMWVPDGVGAGTYRSACAEIKGQYLGISSLLPL